VRTNEKKSMKIDENDVSRLATAVLNVAGRKAIKSKVEKRVVEFKRLREKGSDEDWFSELCFCILTANSTARLGIKIQSALGKKCVSMNQESVEQLLSEHGHRFARPRAEYICKAREHKSLRSTVESCKDDMSAREWLVENILGLGYKEASHFLRNTGHFNVAILDRHILRIMDEYSLIPEIPKTLTRKRYLEIEEKLEVLSERLNIPLGILDFYLWYMKTGEILK